MGSSASVDLVPLERRLHDLLQSLRTSADEQASWLSVRTTAEEVANTLRVRNTEVDHHTVLGKTDLPQTLTSLLSLALQPYLIPTENKTAVVNEILRVGANLCIDHNENRAALLEARFPQAVVALLEAYAETIPSPPTGEPLSLTLANLGIIRTSVGLLLNASLNFDAVKFHLISLEAAVTIIKLSSALYPPTAWTALQDKSGFVEEWTIRSQISSWVWRTVSTLKYAQDDSLHIVTGDVISWITPSLLKYCPPHISGASPLAETDPDLLQTLVQTDFVFLEETCTLIESFALDVEDFRLELARTVYLEKDKSVRCLHALVQFIEEGSYPPLWQNPAIDQSERKAWEKRFDHCKGALIKAFVEVFGEEKNEDVLWESGDQNQPGGNLVATMVAWVKDYAIRPKFNGSSATIRDDMTICASLSLGNLARRASVAEALLSSPYSLAPVLASEEFLSPSADMKLKHGILGLLKHIAQFAKASQIIPKALGEVGIVSKISDSGIWDKKTDTMANVIQLNAIGVVKHLCNGSLEQTFSLVLPEAGKDSTGFSQILALIERSNSISIKSEGSRVIVNLVKSLWLLAREKELSVDTQKKRDRAISYLLTPECAGILAALIARSNRYPILVNEGLVAMTLVTTHKRGGPLVLGALFDPVNQDVSAAATSPSTDDPTLSLPTPSSVDDGLPVPENALDMLIYALRNVDNPVNFPIEVRVNVCTFLLQLQKNVSPDAFARVNATVLPVVQQVVDELQDEPQEEKLFKVASLLAKSLQLGDSAPVDTL